VLNDEKRGIATGQVFPGNQRQLTVPRLMIAVKKPSSLQSESVLLPLRFMDSEDAESQWDFRQSLIACIGLVLAFGFVLRKLIVPISAPSPLYEAALSILVQWLTSGIVAIIGFRWLGLHRSALGIRVPRPLDWAIALATFVVGMIAAGAVSSMFPVSESARSAVKALVSLPLPMRILLVMTAGICEEFLFRGFGIAALTRLIGNRWLSGLLSLAAFTVAHAGVFGWNSGLLIPCVLGFFLTLLFLLRRNVIIGMAVHALIDGISLILVPMVSTKA
jgi:membrane protease YdiL (CAAX protease family)